jgi:hypothetical protein
VRWLHDFGLGVRLAVGGGRTSWSRVVLGTIGIGLATTALLLFASVGHMLGNANARIAARTPRPGRCGRRPAQRLVFAVTALTLPALRGATRLAAMRTE